MQRKRRKKKRFGVFLFLLVVCIGIGKMVFSTKKIFLTLIMQNR